jgi:hypothetical protein
VIRSARCAVATVLVALGLLCCAPSGHALTALGPGLGPAIVYGPTPTDDGYVYAYDAVTDTYVAVPAGAAGPTKPRALYRYTLTAACPRARPYDDIVCTAATRTCALRGLSGLREDVWRAQVAPVTTTYAIVGQLCTGSQAPTLTGRQVSDDVAEYERDHMPVATPRVQPTGVAIVNLPVLVSVVQPQPQVMQVRQPVPGRLVATPTYSWTFDDGTTLTSAGVPFDGTDPRADPAHYLAHTYHGAAANASVSLTATWQATFTAAGRTISLPPLVMPAVTTTFVVDEAKAVLVAG